MEVGRRNAVLKAYQDRTTFAEGWVGRVRPRGAELPFIQSMSDAVAGGLVRFIVVSTHHRVISGSPTTHADCVRAIKAVGGRCWSNTTCRNPTAGMA